MGVLEHHQHRTALRQRFDLADERLEHLLLPRLRRVIVLRIALDRER